MSGFVVVAVEGEIPWTDKDVTVTFEGHNLLLRPGSDTLAPTVVMAYDHTLTSDDALLVIRRFLSSVTWAGGRGIREFMASDGSAPIGIGRRPQQSVLHATLDLDYLPAPADPKAQLALAFYREAKCVNSVPYQFLAYAKIINILYADGPAQKAWINNAVQRIDDYEALKRVATLRSQEPDIGAYLFVSGRCAIAHAYSEPLVDPESPEDIRRLYADLPLIEALAEHLIECEFGIKSRRTVWREHLYELEGFRELLGTDLASRLKAGGPVTAAKIVALPRLSFGLRGHDQLATFGSMTASVISVERGALLLECHSDSGLLTMRILLDFRLERLRHDLLDWVSITDDGSPQVIAHALDQLEFLKGLLLNGEFEVRDSYHRVVLGRCDPFLPVNIDSAATFASLEERKSQLSAEQAKREKGD